MTDLIKRLRDDARHNGHSSDWFVEHCIRVHKACDALERIGWNTDMEACPHDAVVLLYCPERGVTNHERIEADKYSTGERIGQYSNYSCHSWATQWRLLPEFPSLPPE